MSGRKVIIVAVALVVGGVCAAAALAATGQGYKVVGKWGKGGTGNGQFSSNTRGIAVDKAGNVYVADTDNNRIQVFTAKGGFLRKWGSAGSGNGQFGRAEDVDVAPDGTIWVADDGNGRLQQFSSTGAFMTSIAVPTGELARGVAVDADGNVLAAVEGGRNSGFRRYTKTATGWQAAGGLYGVLGLYRADDVEASPDGSIYLVRSATQHSDDRVRRYSADGKPLGSIKLPPSYGTRGNEIDLDCNVWAAVSSTEIAKYSPSGKLLAKATVPYIANDIAVGPNGDLYAVIQAAGVVHLAEDKAKPATATVPARIVVSKGVAKVKYTATGIACPAQVDATASLTGRGIAGKASVKVAAGKTTVITMPVKAPAGKATSATFKIVLKTNGRTTTETRKVTVSAR